MSSSTSKGKQSTVGPDDGPQGLPPPYVKAVTPSILSEVVSEHRDILLKAKPLSSFICKSKKILNSCFKAYPRV